MPYTSVDMTAVSVAASGEGGAHAGALGVSHPLADPPRDVRVYRGVLTNICPAQRDRLGPWARRGVYSDLAL